MKQRLYIFLIALLACVCSAWGQSSPILGASPTDYWSEHYSDSFMGDGSAGNPYQITTAEDLARLARLVNGGEKYAEKYFEQRVDIDLSNYLWVPIGKNGTFTFHGHYNGRGHKITGMTINETYTSTYPVSNGTTTPAPGYGLFGSVNGTSSYANYHPIIENVVLINPRITLDCAEQGKLTRIGLLVGSLCNNSTLKNCNVRGGSILVKRHKGLTSSANMFIGGAVGDCAPGFAGYSANNYGVTIQNISIEADITIEPTTATRNVGNYQYDLGGIVGRMRFSRGPQDNCYYTGKIAAPQFLVSPSYGAVRNTSSTVTADNFAGKFYDASEKSGTKVFFGDYAVMYKDSYRTITPDGNGGYDFAPAEGSTGKLTKSSPGGQDVWTFGNCSGTFTSDMYRAQGVNSCDTYISAETPYSISDLADDFNNSILEANRMRYQWANHDGKLILERLDEATLTYNSASNTLSINFTAPQGSSSITYHWLRKAEEVKSGTAEGDKTYTLPASVLQDITWRAYASYVINGKTYYSNIPEYVQKASAKMPTITLSGNRTENTNNLTLTATLSDPDGIATGEVHYHWTRDGVSFVPTSPAALSSPAKGQTFTAAAITPATFSTDPVEWTVYATFTSEGTEYSTAPVSWTQEPPKMNYTHTDDGTNLTFTFTFDTYGGVLQGVKYVWETFTYNADGDLVENNITEQDTNTHSVSSITFEPKVWHAHVHYTFNGKNYETHSERYDQAASTFPALSVAKTEDSNTQQHVMTASITPAYTGKITNLQYHWTKNGVEQTGHDASRTVPHAFDTQYWRCWATFELDGNSYTTNDETQIYYSTLGKLNFHADLLSDGTVQAILDHVSTLDQGIEVAYTWEDSKGNHGDGDTYDNTSYDAEWVEFKATITDSEGNHVLIKYAHYAFKKECTVVYIDYQGGGNDLNDGLTPTTPVRTWKQAYSLLNTAGWEENVIVIVSTTGTSNMVITEDDTEGKAATITGVWPWEGITTPQDTWGRIIVNGNTSMNGGTRIGAATRFKNVIFWGTNSGNQNRMSCYLHDVTFDTGVQMRNCGELQKNEGAIDGRKAPQFHLNLYGDQINSQDFPQKEEDAAMKVVIRSGQFGRILSSRIAGTKNINTYIIGRHNSPVKVNMTIDIKDLASNRTYYNTSGEVQAADDDIAYLASGLTQGMMYADFNITVKSGRIGTFVAASQGNALRMGDLDTPISTFCGRTIVNIDGHNDSDVVIQNYYGGCQGRVYGSDGICSAYFYGQSTLNLYKGTIEGNIFASSAGISGLRSGDPNYLTKGWYTDDKRIPYAADNANHGYAFGVDYLPYDPHRSMVTMTSNFQGNINLNTTEITTNIYGGIVHGHVYGGSFGYSESLDAVFAPAHAGRLFGNTSVNISGGTIAGNVYGGGLGDIHYFNSPNDNPSNNAKPEQKNRTESEFADVAQVYGDTHVNITGGAINGNIYGGGGGVSSQDGSGGKTASEFLEIAKVYGNTYVTIDASPEWEFLGNIYGGGALGSVVGSTNVIIKSGTILGNVFGGSKGEEGHPDKAKVLGSTNVVLGE